MSLIIVPYENISIKTEWSILDMVPSFIIHLPSTLLLEEKLSLGLLGAQENTHNNDGLI